MDLYGSLMWNMFKFFDLQFVANYAFLLFNQKNCISCLPTFNILIFSSVVAHILLNFIEVPIMYLQPII